MFGVNFQEIQFPSLCLDQTFLTLLLGYRQAQNPYPILWFGPPLFSWSADGILGRGGGTFRERRPRERGSSTANVLLKDVLGKINVAVIIKMKTDNIWRV